MKRLVILASLVLVITGLAISARPVYAEGFSISLSSSSFTVQMGQTVTTTVLVSNLDGGNHTVSLSLSSSTMDISGYFNPSVVTLSKVFMQASSVLTLTAPLDSQVCPGQSSPISSAIIRVSGFDTTTYLSTSASITLNLSSTNQALTVSVQPSQSDYIVGNTVSLSLTSNLPATFHLETRDPNGNVWATSDGSLPSYTFTKGTIVGTTTLGQYTATVSAYYCVLVQSTATFTVSPNTYNVQVSISGLPTTLSAQLLDNGSNATAMHGNQVVTFSEPIGSTHTLQVDQYVAGATGYRYFSRDNTFSTSSGTQHTFNYVAEVHLDVATDPQNLIITSGSGWYSVGDKASIAPLQPEVQGTSDGTKYTFSTWVLDGTPYGGAVTGALTVTMEAPHAVTAKYDTQYLLTVNSDFGSPVGSGYYKSGDTATFSVSTPVEQSPIGFGKQEVFAGWTGGFTGTGSQGTVTMNGPKTVSADWTTSYLQAWEAIFGAVAVIAIVVFLLGYGKVEIAVHRVDKTKAKAEKPPEKKLEEKTDKQSSVS